MSTPAPSTLTFSDVGLTWPEGTVALDRLDLLVSPGRAGLVGANGSGKSTLLELAAGVLRPTCGSVQVSGEVGYLPQDLTLDRGRRIDDLLGIGTAIRALPALDAGSGDPADLEPSATSGTSRSGPRPSSRGWARRLGARTTTGRGLRRSGRSSAGLR